MADLTLSFDLEALCSLEGLTELASHSLDNSAPRVRFDFAIPTEICPARLARYGAVIAEVFGEC